LSETTIWRALNDALRLSMQEDPSVIVMGEDLAHWGTGGGLYGVTRGLQQEFGSDRVLETPISESAIVATAVGGALNGLRPVVEIMFADFSLLAFDAIVNQAAKARYMFGGQFDVPLVIRMAGGSGTSSRAGQHTQSLETLFAHIPGLEVVVPSFPQDAWSLLRSAIGSPNPTIFLEQKSLYNVRGDVRPESIPLGVARVVRPGRDVTVVATQLMLHRSLKAATQLVAEGIDVEVVDLRTLYPLDLDTVERSVRKTRRVLVCHEAPQQYGFGGEIAASISEACWDRLAGPVKRLGSARAPAPYAPELEAEIIPTWERIAVEVRRAYAGMGH
jgi:pyruvate dehydrogenase E1 component beta subunit